MSTNGRRLARLAIAAVITLPVTWAQKSPPPAGNNTNFGGGHMTPNQPSPGLSQGPLNNLIYINGNVMLDDGTPPPDPVTIERVCGGAPRAQAYTDKKGHFSFQLGQTAAIMQDATEEGANLPGANVRMPTGISSGTVPDLAPVGNEFLFANCELRAVLAGYRSDSISLGRRRLLDDPNVGTITLHRLVNVEGAAISLTSLQAPRDARQAYGRALEDIRKGKFTEADRQLNKAVGIYPNFAAAWYELGRIEVRNHEIEHGRQCFARAVSADAKFISPYIELVELDAQAENWGQLLTSTDKLLKLESVDYPMAYLYNAVAHLHLDQVDEAEKSAQAGEKLDTAHRYPRIEQIQAKILAQKKDYAGAAAHLRTYLLLAPNAADSAQMKKDLAELTRLSGQTDEAKAAPEQK